MVRGRVALGRPQPLPGQRRRLEGRGDRTLALEYAKFGITVNCVAPGPVLTPMLAGVPDAIRERIVARVPLGRIADPSEIAGVHAFLASEDAKYITGQVVFIDGGMTAGA